MSKLSNSEKPNRPGPALTPRIKVWLEVDGCYGFGFGTARILEAIQQTGSIKQAAESLDKSYRFIWGRLKAAEKALGRKLVKTQVGGQGERRSELTDFAQDILQQFTTLRQQMFAKLLEEFETHFE